MPESIVNVTEGSGKKLHTWSRTVGANTVEDEVVINGEPHLATYVVTSSATSAATASSHWQLMAGASLNVYVRRIRVFQTSAITTAALVPWTIQRLSTAGTGGTARTPAPLDTSDSAAGATFMELPSSKGTEVGVNAMGTVYSYLEQTIPASQSTGMTLVASWDFDAYRAKGLRIAAGAANGIAVSNRAAAAGLSVCVEIVFTEASY